MKHFKFLFPVLLCTLLLGLSSSTTKRTTGFFFHPVENTNGVNNQ